LTCTTLNKEKKMKILRILFIFTLCFSVVSPGYTSGSKPVNSTSPYQRNIYLEYAEKTANWLKAQAVRTFPGVYRWPAYEDSRRYFQVGIDTGTAGVGLFFLEMYNVTNNEEYREYAEGAGDYLVERSFNTGRVDWLNSAAGVGYYLIELWKATGNDLYMDKANEIGSGLIQQSYRENGGYYWLNYIDTSGIYTGYAHGAAGIGDFLARLFDATRDPLYLEYARGAATWLFSHMWEPEPGRYCWPRLTADTTPNTTWCDGSAGIIQFLLKLYDSTNDSTYLDYAIGGTDWLTAQAVSAGEGTYKWSQGPGSQAYSFAYCHGTPGVVHVLYEMHRRTGNSQYLEYARGGAGWIRQEAEETTAHIFSWPQYQGYSHDTGLLTGTAGVGNSFALYYSFDADTGCLEYARGAAAWLISEAEYDSFEQTMWFNYADDYSENYGPKRHHTGWYYGAAGIGLFFLRLSQTLPPPSAGNQSPVLNPIGNKEIVVTETVEFSVSGQDPDQGPGPLYLMVSYLPQGASFIDNHFSWTPNFDQSGAYNLYFIVTDGWEADWEHVVINVRKIKKAKIRR
jgi:rhamnogalacturonyl hydrolase YesR